MTRAIRACGMTFFRTIALREGRGQSVFGAHELFLTLALTDPAQW